MKEENSEAHKYGHDQTLEEKVEINKIQLDIIRRGEPPTNEMRIEMARITEAIKNNLKIMHLFTIYYLNF